MKKNTLSLSIAALCLLGLSTHSWAAGYIKLDGVDGESTDSGHKDWINVLSIDTGTARPGQTLIGLTKGGKRVRLTQDGRYRLANGDMIIVVDSKVGKVEPAGLLLPAVQKQTLNPGETKGFNPQPEPPAKTVKKFTTPGQSKGFNPQPEPPARSR